MGACGDDGPAPHYDLLDAAIPAIDASMGTDAGDVSSRDAMADAAGDAGDVPSTCHVLSGTNTVVAERFFDPQGAISVAAHAQGALISWSQYSGGKSRVHSRWFGVAADAVDAPSVDDAADQVDVHSAAMATGFLTTWTDASGVRARRTDDNGMTLDGASLAIASDVDHAVSAQGADGKLLVAFPNGSQGSTLLLGADAKPIGSVHDVPGFGAVIGRPALAALGTGYLLAWVDAGTHRVHVQNLDATGKSSTLSKIIDSDGDAQGNVDLATTASGGAVAWDVLVSGERAEVHLRTFGADAAPTGIEQTVTPYPDTGLHPALIAARGGFLVAYRSTQPAQSALRLALLDNRGKALSSTSIASLQQQDLPLAMRITDDGSHIFVGWLDQTLNTTEYQLQRTWIGCD